jgi:hypothetical protein
MLLDISRVIVWGVLQKLGGKEGPQGLSSTSKTHQLSCGLRAPRSDHPVSVCLSVCSLPGCGVTTQVLSWERACRVFLCVCPESLRNTCLRNV